MHGPRTACLLLLAGDRLGLALAGARIGVRALATNRQTLTVTQTTIAGKVHKTLDVHRGRAAKIAFDGIIGIDRFADVQDFLIGQVLNTASVIDSQLVGDLQRLVRGQCRGYR